ncbi:efflux RND transporter periplasmic adaptor subunit, partial [Myxococcota bacterium]|nr:efflux RND transporter periplasmic adaptor subunit [Myxococcota bacterium]
RRLAEAALAVKTAEATLDAARRRLDQFQRVSETQARGEAVLEVRAPLAGHVTEVFTAPGSFVEVGAPLFRVTDTTQVWIEAAIAEIDVPRLGTPRAAEFRVDGLTEPIVLGPEALVARGQLVDPVSRTLTVAYAADNAGGRVPVGAFARARIATDDERPALAVADSALVDDGGTTVVFVQVEGEAFERRVVRLGLRDRGFVEVLSGVADGEWVVTRGAWSVKLAASSGTIPAHGHAH